MGKRVLLTGGAGYIGSHTYLALIEAGYAPVILDNFANAQDEVPARLAQITGAEVPVILGDIRDGALLAEAFATHSFDAVVHFAALKSVAESVENPLEYFRVNIGGLTSLLTAMDEAGCWKLVFSSSATVYGEPDKSPTEETAERRAVNPYGATKIISEQMLEMLGPNWAIGVLRYFNPAGTHASGLIGEDPKGRVENLMPIMAEVARGDRAELSVFGDDYDTPDGTAIRDYIHVEDLARGHVLSLNRLFETGRGHLVNLGTGTGYSVLEMVAAYSRAIGRDLPHKIVERRPGDVPIYCAETSKAAEVLGFRTERSLEEICDSSWRWTMRNTR
ncbi:MAG: UDP-glucose 4-epimerase GalE [Pseudomonadota bacterium]